MQDRNGLNMRLKIFATGGTFDKVYDEYSGRLIFDKTHLPEMLSVSRCKLNIDIETILLMDSLDMNLGHRQEISQRCKDCLENRIVITHGTDTMIETANVIAQGNYDKTVVLTGAIIPYSFGNSDAISNLCWAIAYVQIIPIGVYVAMHGKLFNYDNVRKNKTTNEFETIK